MHVLLFDIDGTLIRSGGAGKLAMESALQNEFRVPELIDRVSYAGRTDPGIIRDLLTLHGLEDTPTHQDRLMSAYLRELPVALAKRHGEVLPGIVDALRTAGDDVVIGLLTGNVRAGAEIKLRHFGLWDHFAFGAFADGLPNRDDVARRSLTEIERHVGQSVDPEQIWVIGDTPADVQCARAIGARAVVVATGWHSPAELRASSPDYFLPDFTHATELLQHWGWQ